MRAQLLVLLFAAPVAAAPLAPRERAVAQVFELVHAGALDHATVMKVLGQGHLFARVAVASRSPWSVVLEPDPALGLRGKDFTRFLLDARHGFAAHEFRLGGKQLGGAVVWFVVDGRELGLGTPFDPDHAYPVMSIEISCTSHVGANFPTLREATRHP